MRFARIGPSKLLVLAGKSCRKFGGNFAGFFLEPILGRACDDALFSEKKGFSVQKGGGNAVNEGFGEDFYRKSNSVKERSGPFSEPPDSEN